jgi:hypothetical protein
VETLGEISGVTFFIIYIYLRQTFFIT